jgi:BASS family bile acid:Na+ symporter
MILIAGFWGVWHLVSGLTLALIWSRSADTANGEGL